MDMQSILQWNSLIKILSEKNILSSEDLVQIWKDCTSEEKQKEYFSR